MNRYSVWSLPEGENVSGGSLAGGAQARDVALMNRALELARRGRGAVEPNPMVGCVLVKNGGVVSEGFHEKVGGAHAEPNALAAFVGDAAGASAFVNLEPCCHLTKRTPPCVPRLIAAKIARVVVGCPDPNPLVSGQGIAQLRAAGIEVTENILGARARQLNAAFFKHVEQRRPYVTLKWAQTADGKIASRGNSRLKISGARGDAIVHKLRSLADAILVGVGTVLSDDPLLTVRGIPGARQPIRVVLDTHLRIPISSRLISTAGDSRVLIYCGEEAMQTRTRLTNLPGVDVHAVPLESDGRISLGQVLNDLGGRQITHVMVEPGPILAREFLRQNLADRIWILRSDQPLTDPAAPDAVTIDFPFVGEFTAGSDRFTEYLNPTSTVYFSPDISADFHIVGEMARPDRTDTQR